MSRWTALSSGSGSSERTVDFAGQDGSLELALQCAVSGHVTAVDRRQASVGMLSLSNTRGRSSSSPRVVGLTSRSRDLSACLVNNITPAVYLIVTVLLSFFDLHRTSYSCVYSVDRFVQFLFTQCIQTGPDQNVSRKFLSIFSPNGRFSKFFHRHVVLWNICDKGVTKL